MARSYRQLRHQRLMTISIMVHCANTGSPSRSASCYASTHSCSWPLSSCRQSTQSLSCRETARYHSSLPSQTHHAHPSPLLAHLTELQLLITSHLTLLDVYSIHLTNRHFNNISQPVKVNLNIPPYLSSRRLRKKISSTKLSPQPMPSTTRFYIAIAGMNGDMSLSSQASTGNRDRGGRGMRRGGYSRGIS